MEGCGGDGIHLFLQFCCPVHHIMVITMQQNWHGENSVMLEKQQIGLNKVAGSFQVCGDEGNDD